MEIQDATTLTLDHGALAACLAIMDEVMPPPEFDAKRGLDIAFTFTVFARNVARKALDGHDAPNTLKHVIDAAIEFADTHQIVRGK